MTVQPAGHIPTVIDIKRVRIYCEELMHAVAALGQARVGVAIALVLQEAVRKVIDYALQRFGGQVNPSPLPQFIAVGAELTRQAQMLISIHAVFLPAPVIRASISCTTEG